MVRTFNELRETMKWTAKKEQETMRANMRKIQFHDEFAYHVSSMLLNVLVQYAKANNNVSPDPQS